MNRIVAIGDLNGAADALEEILDSAGVVDGRGRWCGGATHVVQVGDVFNRGPAARAAFLRLRTLDRSARASGGAVSVLLGNHEAMTALRYESYCTVEEYLSFAAPAARHAWDKRVQRAVKRLLQDHARGGPILPLHPRLDAWAIARVPGRRELRRAMSRRGRIGRAIRRLPVALRVGRTAFVHSVPALAWAHLGVDGLNAAAREAWAEAPRFWRDLSRRHLFRAADGPLWNRALVRSRTQRARREAERVLGALDADRIVIGHTQTLSVPGGEHGHIALLHDGRVVCVDVSLAAGPGAPRSALLIDRSQGWEINAGGKIRLW